MIIKAVAIDDEPPALEVISHFCAKTSFITLHAKFTNTKDALAYLVDHQPDLIFLDIMMPGIKGTEFALMLKPLNINFIFTTAHAHYAVEGFELQALDYLLKPISWPRFTSAINKAYKEIAHKKGGSASIFVKDSYDWVRIKLAEIQYIKSDSNLLFIHFKEGAPVSTRMTMSEILVLLPSQDFMRIHKSYIVATEAIQKLERHQITIGTTSIPVGSAYRDMLASTLLGNNQLNGKEK